MKRCRKCNEYKSKNEFSKNKRYEDGLSYYCRSCVSKYYYKRHEYFKKRGKESREKNKNRNKEYNKKYYEDNKNNSKNKYFLKTYGITVETYNNMLEKQEGRCYICGKTQKDNLKALAVDHCHETGEVRKLLCSNCNLALGFINDDEEILKKMIDYLKIARHIN